MFQKLPTIWITYNSYVRTVLKRSPRNPSILWYSLTIIFSFSVWILTHTPRFEQYEVFANFLTVARQKYKSKYFNTLSEHVDDWIMKVDYRRDLCCKYYILNNEVAQVLHHQPPWLRTNFKPKINYVLRTTAACNRASNWNWSTFPYSNKFWQSYKLF